MNEQWKRAHVLSINRIFLNDVSRIREFLGIPSEGYGDAEQSREYAKLLHYEYNRHKYLVPIDPITKKPLAEIPRANTKVDISRELPLMREWGIGLFARTGGSPTFPTEVFRNLSDDPIEAYAIALSLRYRLPVSSVVENAIKQFILTNDINVLEFDIHAPPVGIQAEYEDFQLRESVKLTLTSVAIDMTKKDWNVLFGRWKRLIRAEQTYREPHRFDFYRFIYRKTRIEGESQEIAELEWAEVEGDLTGVTNGAIALGLRSLEVLMEPYEPSSTT